MTTETDLLPLPDGRFLEIRKDYSGRDAAYGFTPELVQEWGRANVAHAIAPLQAEIEALRAERDMYKDADESMQQAHHEALTRAREAEARAEQLAEALQWYVDTDDTNDGQEGNEFWIAGRDRARAALNPTAAQEGE